MATHSSILAWRTPRTEEPGELQSMGSHKVRPDWSDLACTQYRTRYLKLDDLKTTETFCLIVLEDRNQMCQNQRCKITVLRAMLPETVGENPSLSLLGFCWWQSVLGVPYFCNYVPPVSISIITLSFSWVSILMRYWPSSLYVTVSKFPFLIMALLILN